MAIILGNNRRKGKSMNKTKWEKKKTKRKTITKSYSNENKVGEEKC